MHVNVVPYDPQWRERFVQEAAALRDIFGDLLVALHHIGSTSVPGLPAKPIIDMLPVVWDITRVDARNAAMMALGYEPMGEFGILGRRYFRKGGDHRTHQLHVFQYDNREAIDRHLAFRDYLRAHQDDAERYGALKVELARRHPTDIIAYMEGKDPFIKAMEHTALLWYQMQPQG